MNDDGSSSPGRRVSGAPSYAGSAVSSFAAFPRRPATHPNISRLRSAQHPRLPSASSQSTLLDRASSGFDRLSRSSSELHLPAELVPLPEVDPAPAPLSGRAPAQTFKWSPLRRVSTRLYQPKTANSTAQQPELIMGLPTVVAVSGVIAVGTDKGWVGIFDFGQNLRSVCGTEAIARESGPVTALAISQDHTFIAVGHANGAIHLYALAKPSVPARSVPPTTLPLVLTGRKEGHLEGSRILHLGFVGARHTAIVSSDETGLAFYHSLGKVLMLASTDIIRMLGRYPDPTTHPPPSPFSPINATPESTFPALNGDAKLVTKSKKPSTILDMAPLPLGPAPHCSDDYSLVALLTPTKLVVVGLKPAPRTWWRATQVREADSASSYPDYSRNGVLAWYPSYATDARALSDDPKEAIAEGEDPVLAFAWEKSVRLVRVQKETKVMGTKGLDIDFVESKGWRCDEIVLGLQWYSQRILCVLTSLHIEVFDIVTQQRIGQDAFDLRKLVAYDSSPPGAASARKAAEFPSYAGSFKMYKRKLFVLTSLDVRVGAILSWADRILGLMQPVTILEAIEVTTAYLLGHVDASTIDLPDDVVERRDMVEPKLREILDASLDFVFSDDRLRDGTHSDSEAMQQLLEQLVGTCVRACLATGDVEWLFDDLYERYEQSGIESIFLERIEPFVLSGSVHALPPSVSQRLIAIHEERHQYEAAQRIMWHVDPEALDINQALGLCQRQRLFDALIYVYTRSMRDYVSPVVELLALVRRIQWSRQTRPNRIGEYDEGYATAPTGDEDIEATVPDAYKIYAFLSQALAGLSYPSKDPLPYADAVLARNSLYSFIFSGCTLVWPEPGGRAVLTSDVEDAVEPSYPYLRLLLQFDAEAMLDALDLAFEESYLEDDIPGKPLTRQQIVNLLLDVMTAQRDFSPVDRTFLNIFLARNLPKYPQYIKLSPKALQSILVGLAGDEDQSTTEDRQLAVEYLLSVYVPTDSESMVALFEQARFFRILRSIYRGERRWAALASTYLRDPDIGYDTFACLRETLRLASRAGAEQKQELVQVLLDAVTSLVQADEDGLQQTADLMDAFLPEHHAAVLVQLASSPWRQFAYLRFLLEPAYSFGPDASSSAEHERPPSSHLDRAQKLQYLALLCTHERDHVIRFLKSDTAAGLAETADVMQICADREVFDALVWSMDRSGRTGEALDMADETLGSRVDLIVRGLLGGEEADDQELDANETSDAFGGERDLLKNLVLQIAAILKVFIQICAQTSTGPVPSAATKSGTVATNGMTGEDLWFRLLCSAVTTVQAIKTVATPPDPSASDRSSKRRTSIASSIIIHDDSPRTLSPLALEVLDSLIPTVLSALVSTNSTAHVSFPNLMRRLIDSNARSIAADRSYAEFKGIVTSMLETYVFEGELLTITSKITAQDLFAHVAELEKEHQRGWRFGGGRCAECGEGFSEEEAGGRGMSRSASAHGVVEALGLNGRPRMEKRPSLKGKEVEWPTSPSEWRGEDEARVMPLRGVVVGRSGEVWHQSCHLTRRSIR